MAICPAIINIKITIKIKKMWPQHVQICANTIKVEQHIVFTQKNGIVYRYNS